MPQGAYIFRRDLTQNILELHPPKDLDLLLNRSRFGRGELHYLGIKFSILRIGLLNSGRQERLDVPAQSRLLRSAEGLVGHVFEQVEDIDGGHVEFVGAFIINAGNDDVLGVIRFLGDHLARENEVVLLPDGGKFRESPSDPELLLGPVLAQGL